MPSQETAHAERVYNSTCTIARSLDVIGARWSLLILREAVNGITRFADFRELLGVAPDVLSDRLASLVEAGLLEKQRYQAPGERPRDEYVLTQRGRDLKLVMAALHDWGDVHVPSEFGVTTTRRRISDDAEVHVAFVDAEGHVVPPDEVYSAPRPGTPAETFFERRSELRERAAATR
ncbi:winged helix-turn-helix transcriptional regulator [Gryllotalpicola protaetiae]|uniref:Transcriptional regulator n=1 Tax=Gryllotalpicola protaetiae TaxID=2419771 RepID=A0A387BM74_9MICO|nr:helix-turn-helix domain-containing protein [Gryllotalpicola protaetiae]AYG03492.1 transcriptional regulator [Gryllotalpicola protaetiae]